MLHHIELPKDEIISLSTLAPYRENLSSSAGVINIFYCTKSKQTYILGHWQPSPLPSGSELKQLNLSIGGEINPNQPLDSELQKNLNLGLEYVNIKNNNACMLVHDEWNMCYLTCMQTQEIENLHILKSRISEININNPFSQYGIYQLNDIQQLCQTTAKQLENNKNIYNYLTDTDEIIFVVDNMAANFLLNERKLFKKLPPEARTMIWNYLDINNIVQIRMTSNSFNLFSSSKHVWKNKLFTDFAVSKNDICALKCDPLILYKSCFKINDYINQQKIDELVSLIKENPFNFQVLILLLPDNESGEKYNTISKLLSSNFNEHSFLKSWKWITDSMLSLSPFGQSVLISAEAYLYNQTLKLKNLCKLKKFENYMLILQNDIKKVFSLENAVIVINGLSKCHNNFQELIYHAIFSNLSIFTSAFKDFSRLNYFLLWNLSKIEPVANILYFNDDLFKQYIPDKETLDQACKIFGKQVEQFSQLFIEKYNKLHADTEEDSKIILKF